MSLITLESLKDLKGLQAKSASNKLFVLYFHAEWSEASKEMTPAIMELASDYASSDSTSSSICIASVDADGEKVSSFDKLCQVKVVPAVVCVVGDNAISKVEGLNVPLVVSTISECLKTCASLPGASATSASSTSTSASATPAAPASETKEELETRMKKIIKSYPVMVFIKGSATEPRCKFSRQLVEILNEQKIDFKTFDILQDNAVREGLKVLSDWPTYPQVYVDGELVGGLDVVKQMIEAGEFVAPKKLSLEDRLHALVAQQSVMIFIKGTPEKPLCGFTRQALEVLRASLPDDAQFGSFDILSDNAVREGLKKLFNWPTYPQLYVRGELVGGLDVMKDMAENGELKDLLAEATQKAAA